MEKGGAKVLIIILVILIIVAGGVLGYKIMKDRQNTEEVVEENEILAEEPEEAPKEVQIFKRK